MNSCSKCGGKARYRALNGVDTLCGSCFYSRQVVHRPIKPPTLIPRALMCHCYGTPLEINCSICYGRKRVPIPMTELYDPEKAIKATGGWIWL